MTVMNPLIFDSLPGVNCPLNFITVALCPNVSYILTIFIYYIERGFIMTNNFFIKVLQGALIGLGAVLPGISGGVLGVIFGVYKPIMELLASPRKNFKTHVPKLLPVFLGGAIGFLGIASLLSIVLNKYPTQSVCVFVGLIVGMLPSLFKEAGEKGRSTGSYISLVIGFVVTFVLILLLHSYSVTIIPNFYWYIFCGFCVALSIIAPGMSFSTLLMPLDLYTPFVAGLGGLDIGVLLPGGIGGLLTVILLSKLVNSLFEKHYSIAFHAIVGIVISATILIIPFDSFTSSLSNSLIHIFCLCGGIVVSQLLMLMEKKVPAV